MKRPYRPPAMRTTHPPVHFSPNLGSLLESTVCGAGDVAPVPATREAARVTCPKCRHRIEATISAKLTRPTL